MVYKAGDLWLTCDVCGTRGYGSEMVETWNGLMVHEDTCYDGPRDPLDKPPPLHIERQTVPDPRPRYKDRATVLETVSVTSIATTTAVSGGNVTNDGGATVTEYGVCWATSTAPTISDTTTSDGTGTGEFTSNLTGLTAGTKYHVRAYATNSVGTAYAAEATFVTRES
jgi:hypothetical protein